MTALTKNWRPQKRRPMSHLSPAAQQNRSSAFLLYRASHRPTSNPSDDARDVAEAQATRSSADGERAT